MTDRTVVTHHGVDIDIPPLYIQFVCPKMSCHRSKIHNVWTVNPAILCIGKGSDPHPPLLMIAERIVDPMDVPE